MSVVGNLLREARVKRGLDLSALAKSLNISIANLEAIEKGNFKLTPGDPYTFGFVKAYSDYLNLDTDLITKIYKDETKLPLANEILIPRVTNPKHYNYLKYSFSFLVFLTFAIFFYNLFLSETYTEKKYVTISDMDDAMVALLEEEELKQGLEEFKKIKKEISLSKNEKNLLKNQINIEDNNITQSSALASVSDKKINIVKNNLKIRIINDTWVNITNESQNIILSRLMKADEEFILSNEAIYMITTGNAGNIELVKNNKSSIKLGKKGEILNSYPLTMNLFDNQ